MASVASQLIEEVTAHTQRDSLDILALDNHKMRQYEIHAARYTTVTNSVPKGKRMSVRLICADWAG